MKQLLIDTMLFKPLADQINEARGDNDRIIVTGVLQRAEAKNQNGRIYPKKILMREAKKYLDAQVKERRAMGELDHPDSSVINLKNVSHHILDLHWKGDDLMGKVEILPTPSGNILRQLLGSGIRLGISSRGLGSVEEIAESTVQVQDDFELIGWDFVSNPSTHGAFMYPKEAVSLADSVNEGVLTEGITADVKPINPKIERISNNITNIICEIGDVCDCIFE